MRDGEPGAILLSAYRPPEWTIESTDLTFELVDGETRVRNRMQVRRTASGTADAPLRLDGQQLELLSVEVDGVAPGGNRYRVDDDSLTLFELPESAEITVETRIHPEANTALEGLYRSGGMYCTQCEAEGFRKITYYLDRPDVLARFTTTIIADGARYPVMLSNGNRVADQTLDDGRRSVTWEDPFPKPSYLFALVAGDLAVLRDEFVTRSGRQVTLEIYSEPHNIGQCDYAMDVLKRSMRWDEEVFGREYDLDVFMIVAVDDFNMGAMENKGLNIFNTSCVLASPDTATDADYQKVESVVAHEYFHNWSGNRVTCRDWFQLSLKEGFTVFRDAEFSSDMNSRTRQRIDDVTVLRSVQFAEDAGPLAHPVRPSSYIEISNFYTPTVYEKGSELVRMLHRLLGPEAFRRGSDLYFDRHDGQAVTTEDFVAAMADAGTIDLRQFQRWYEQAGTPTVTVAARWSDGCLRLDLAQRCPATVHQADKAPLHIPLLLGLIAGDGSEIDPGTLDIVCDDPVETRAGETPGSVSLLVHLRSETATLEFRGLAARPVVSFLRGFSAPIRVEYPREPGELALLALHDTDGFARWDALQTLVVREVERLVGDPDAAVDAALIDLYGALLRRTLEAPQQAETRLLLATMLTLPDAGYLFEQFERIDVDGVVGALDRIRVALADALRDDWQALYDGNRATGPYQPEALSIARRELRNVAQDFLATGLSGTAAADLLEQAYREADNLTDRRAALQAVTRHPGIDGSRREALLGDFLERWRSEALVVNLWFTLQATSPLSGPAELAALEAHPAFDPRNPNKLRALYGAFARLNHPRFHALDGSGYRFLGAAVARLDRSNPQVAARLALPLTRWRRYDTRRQTLMRGELERLAAADGLSADLYEVVSKSLDVSA